MIAVYVLLQSFDKTCHREIILIYFNFRSNENVKFGTPLTIRVYQFANLEIVTYRVMTSIFFKTVWAEFFGFVYKCILGPEMQIYERIISPYLTPSQLRIL